MRALLVAIALAATTLGAPAATTAQTAVEVDPGLTGVYRSDSPPAVVLVGRSQLVVAWTDAITGRQCRATYGYTGHMTAEQIGGGNMLPGYYAVGVAADPVMGYPFGANRAALSDDPSNILLLFEAPGVPHASWPALRLTKLFGP